MGELVKVKDEVWNKVLRNNCQDISSTVLSTIENADFAIRDTDGSTLYVKRFESERSGNLYNIVVVNKHGEVEDYVSSVHIKRDGNLRNKIKMVLNCSYRKNGIPTELCSETIQHLLQR